MSSPKQSEARADSAQQEQNKESLMKLKNKIKLGIAATVGGVAAGIALNKGIDSLIDQNLSRNGIQNIRQELMNEEGQDVFSNSPEILLGKLFYSSTPHINISVPNRDGRHITAMLYKQENENSKYAVIVHGYRSSVKAVSYLARRYFENGYNVLIPYMRAHHGSDYEYCTMGWHERFDIIDWVNYIDSISVNANIILHGVSMGAATVMMVTGEHLIPAVKCAIEDCGYTSVYDAYRYKIPHLIHLPAFPTVDILRYAVKSKVGFDIKEASALAQVRKSHTPTLFIHGDSDTVVPVSMVRELYSNAICKKELLICKRADHALCPLLYPEEYWAKVWSFIEKHEK